MTLIRIFCALLTMVTSLAYAAPPAYTTIDHSSAALMESLAAGSTVPVQANSFANP